MSDFVTVLAAIAGAVIAGLIGVFAVTYSQDRDQTKRQRSAALAIRDWVLDQDTELRLRIAVNTGEALIALGARPAQGEGMASGDVVNTAARLQAAAPVNSILVGDSTYRATRHVIDYRAVEPVDAKGKADPVGAWEAIEARSRVGDLLKTDRAPLIGRAKELGLVTDLLDRVRRERTSQLVTIAGVPGIGKSRLVAEFFGLVDQDPTEMVRWRQGRDVERAGLPVGEDGQPARPRVQDHLPELARSARAEWDSAEERAVVRETRRAGRAVPGGPVPPGRSTGTRSRHTRPPLRGRPRGRAGGRGEDPPGRRGRR